MDGDDRAGTDASAGRVRATCRPRLVNASAGRRQVLFVNFELVLSPYIG